MVIWTLLLNLEDSKGACSLQNILDAPFTYNMNGLLYEFHMLTLTWIFLGKET